MLAVPDMRALAALLAVLVGALSLSGASAKDPPLPYNSLSDEFVKFYDKTANVPEDKRVQQFRRKFGEAFPGFYAPDGQTDAEFNASIARALADFPRKRARFEEVERDFPAAYRAGIAHMQTQFPGFQQTMPVYFLHSLSRMDGGTRTYDKKQYLIFGADMIADIHDARDMGPFLDHELFHVENAKWFKDCAAMWCSLWQEGLATWAASQMNPGADDHQLLLDKPRPIRAKVDATWRDALCQTAKDLLSTDKAVYARYFYGKVDPKSEYPPRYGYYVGYRLMQHLSARYTLRQLDRMGNSAAATLISREMQNMLAEAGGCASRRA